MVNNNLVEIHSNVSVGNEQVLNTELKVFNCDLGEVRVIIDDNNDILFCLRDICKVLELDSVNKVANAIKAEFEVGELNSCSFDTGFGIKEFSMITEPQLYFILMRSNKPQAKPFRQWVVNEVLPSIRKNGGYIANQENLTPEQIVANALIVAQNIIAERDKTIVEQKQVIEYQGNKLDSYKEIEKNRRSKEELAKRLNKHIRTLAVQKMNSNFQAAYNFVYSEFSKVHNINEKINMEYLKKNNDYLSECLSIVLSELD